MPPQSSIPTWSPHGLLGLSVSWSSLSHVMLNCQSTHILSPLPAHRPIHHGVLKIRSTSPFPTAYHTKYMTPDLPWGFRPNSPIPLQHSFSVRSTKIPQSPYLTTMGKSVTWWLSLLQLQNAKTVVVFGSQPDGKLGSLLSLQEAPATVLLDIASISKIPAGMGTDFL